MQTVNVVFGECTSLNEAYLPETMAVVPVGLFYKCSDLTTLNWEQLQLTEIGDNAFNRTGFQGELKLLYTITKIGNFAFSDCYGLKKVILPNRLETLGAGCFKNCFGLTSVGMAPRDWKVTNGNEHNTIYTGNPTQNAIWLTSIYVEHTWTRR